MSTHVTTGTDVIEFTYSWSGHGELTIALSRDGFNSSWANDDPTLQSIGEALIPSVNANADPEADYTLISITKYGPIVVTVT